MLIKKHLTIVKNKQKSLFSSTVIFVSKKKPPAGLHHTEDRIGDAPKPHFSKKSTEKTLPMICHPFLWFVLCQCRASTAEHMVRNPNTWCRPRNSDGWRGVDFLIFVDFQCILLEMGVLVHPQLGLRFGAALPGAFFCRKTTFLRHKIHFHDVQMFFH